MDLQAMSVVGTKEIGVRTVSAAPSPDYGAGVPIKKRRFPFIRPPSPPLLPEEAIDAKQTELVCPSNALGVSNPNVASEHPPSSIEKGPSFGLNLSENIDLNEVDKVQPDNQDSTVAVVDSKNAEEKPHSPIKKSADPFEGPDPSPSSDATDMDQKEKPGEMKNIVVADRTQRKIELMLAPGGSLESEAVQGSSGPQTLHLGMSTDLTLALGQKIGPVCWHQGNLKDLSLRLSLSGRESDLCSTYEVSKGVFSTTCVHVDRSTLDLNTATNATDYSAPVFSYCTAPYRDLTLAFRENDEKDAGQNLHVVEQRAMGGKTSSPYDYKEDHIGRYLDLGLRPLIPNSNPSCESPPVSTILNPIDNLGLAVKFIKKDIISLSRVKKEPADEPVDFCNTKPENRIEKCESIGSFPIGTHLGNSISIKVEPDCMNRQINQVNDSPCRQEEMQNFSALPPNEAETMQINGPLGFESCQSVLASSWGCSDQHLVENGQPLVALSHHQECDAANMASDSTVTNVAASGHDYMVDLMLKEDLSPTVKDSAMENTEDSACDGGKIDISGCDYTYSFDSKYESDGAPSAPADHAEISYQEDEDYEDGEVRERLVLGASQVHTWADQVESSSRATGVTECNAQLASKRDFRSQLAGIGIENRVNGFSDATQADTRDIDKGQSRELLNEGVPSNPVCSFDIAELVDGDLTKHIQEEMICQPGQSSTETLHVSNERVHIDDAINIKERGHLSKIEAPVNREVSSIKGNKRRIINLSGNGRVILDRSLPLGTVGKRLPDTALEVDKQHLRGRNKSCGDDFDEFPRVRNRYSLSRNSRSNFNRDRDIVSNSVVRTWNVKREFSPELYNYPGERHTTKCKYASDYRNNDVASGGKLSDGKCWGRRRLNNEGPNIQRQSSMQCSPCGRGGVPSQAMPSGDHMPRNISPTRCIGRDDFDVVSLWNNHKFRRDFGGDDTESMFVCSRISCEDGLTRGARKLHSFKNDRVLGRFRSRRNRSPNQGSNRRRSLELPEGHLDLSQRRSPVVNRRNRMRSPDRSYFHSKLTRRQHPYLSQNSEDVRQIHSERDNGFLRSRFTNRSSPCRDTFRIRRYGVSTRDGPCNEYSKVHVRNGWSRDIRRDGESGEIGFGEDRGPRHFQSPYSESEESVIYNKDEAASPYHVCSEDHSMYPESGNSREKTKNRSGSVQKTRKTEDREGNYRRRRLCEEFDDPQNKRKRFDDPGLQSQLVDPLF